MAALNRLTRVVRGRPFASHVCPADWKNERGKNKDPTTMRGVFACDALKRASRERGTLVPRRGLEPPRCCHR
jgi:hypothetical protein